MKTLTVCKAEQLIHSQNYIAATELGRVAPMSFNFKPGSNLNLNLVQPQIALHQSGSSVDLRSILNCHLTTDQILISVQLVITHAH